MDTTIVPVSSSGAVTPLRENPSVVLHEGKLIVSVSGIFKEALVDAIKRSIGDQLPLAHELEVRLDPRYATHKDDVIPAVAYLMQLTSKIKKEREFSASLVELTEATCSALRTMKLDKLIGIKAAENAAPPSISIPDDSPKYVKPSAENPMKSKAYSMKFDRGELIINFTNQDLNIEDLIRCQDVMARFIDRKFDKISVDLTPCKTILPEHVISVSKFSNFLASGGMIDLAVSDDSTAAATLESHSYLRQFIKLL